MADDQLQRLLAAVQTKSTNGVVFHGTAGSLFGADERGYLLLAVPPALLVALREAWVKDDGVALTYAVRDLFDGQDGDLQFLAAIARRGGTELGDS